MDLYKVARGAAAVTSLAPGGATDVNMRSSSCTKRDSGLLGRSMYLKLRFGGTEDSEIRRYPGEL